MKPAATLLCLALPLAAQTRQFEVASVKPSTTLPRDTAPEHLGVHIDGARVEIGLGSLMLLVTMAYNVESYQVVGPDWLATSRFDVMAKLPEGSKTDQIPEMLQSLLAERFKLAVHREPKERSVYALIVGPDGVKMKPTPPDYQPTAKAFPDGPMDRIPIAIEPSPDGFRTYSRLKSSRVVFEAAKIDSAELARVIAAYVDDPVVDSTGLKGYWQVTLDVPGGPNYKRQAAARARAGVGPTSVPAEPSGVNILASVEKLGLKLEKRKGPVEYLFVDHVEKAPVDQ